MHTTKNDAAFGVVGYTEYLRDVVGAADATRLHYLPTVRRFVAARSSGSDVPGWTGLSVQLLTEFIREEAASKTGHGRTAPASATRSFLQFLAWRCVAPSGLDCAISRIRRARLSGDMRGPAEAGSLVGTHLQAFFAKHLRTRKRVSPQTIACYRDTFRPLLRFIQGKTGTEPSALPLAALDADAVLAFLDHRTRPWLLGEVTQQLPRRHPLILPRGFAACPGASGPGDAKHGDSGQSQRWLCYRTLAQSADGFSPPSVPQPTVTPVSPGGLEWIGSLEWNCLSSSVRSMSSVSGRLRALRPSSACIVGWCGSHSDKRLVHYLSRDEVEALIGAPDRTVWSGRRDHALLLTLYNTGARVSEVIALRREQGHLDTAGAHAELLGKGRKERVVPLWAETAQLLRAWFRELGDDGNSVVLPGVRGRVLSRLHRPAADPPGRDPLPSLSRRKAGQSVCYQRDPLARRAGT